MSLVQVHDALARSSTWFMAILAVWAFYAWIRSQPLSSSWSGAAAICELLILVQFGLGWILWFQGAGAAMPRAWIHILYAVVAVIGLPAAYMYFNRLEDSRVQALAMALSCAFLWGILLRAAQVVYMQAPA